MLCLGLSMACAPTCPQQQPLLMCRWPWWGLPTSASHRWSTCCPAASQKFATTPSLPEASKWAISTSTGCGIRYQSSSCCAELHTHCGFQTSHCRCQAVVLWTPGVGVTAVKQTKPHVATVLPVTTATAPTPKARATVIATATIITIVQ